MQAAQFGANNLERSAACKASKRICLDYASEASFASVAYPRIHVARPALAAAHGTSNHMSTSGNFTFAGKPSTLDENITL